MADNSRPQSGGRARYKFTHGQGPHPDAKRSGNGEEFVSRTPGGLRVASKELPLLRTGDNLRDHLDKLIEPITRTRRVQREKAADTDNPSKRGEPSGGLIVATRPPQEGDLAGEEEEEEAAVADGQDDVAEIPSSISDTEVDTRPKIMLRLHGKGRATPGWGTSGTENGSLGSQDSPGLSSLSNASLPNRKRVVKRDPPREGTPARAEPSSANNRKYTDDPPRFVTVPSPVPLLMDKHMASYHGSKPIPKDIVVLRNDIKNNFVDSKGKVQAITKLYRKYDKLFRADGKIKKQNPLMEFYMDLRLFREETWDSLTIEYRPNDDGSGKRHIQAPPHLVDKDPAYNFAGNRTLDVPKPPGWDYEADLKYVEGGEDE